MKLLVSGGAGFIGHHFIRYVLENTDASVVCLDRIDSAGDMNRLTLARTREESGELHRLAFVHHDLRAEINWRVGDALLTGRGTFDAKPFDHVVHMAAGSHVDRSVVDPMGFVLDNVVGTAHLLDFCRNRRVVEGKILYFSTDEVFGPAPEGVSFEPWARFKPNNPYAASKAGGEALCPAYANTYGLPILVTHCTNVFGERQHWEKFIPLVIRQIQRGEMVKIHSDASKTQPASRFYTYVDNVSSAVMLLLEKGRCLGQGTLVGTFLKRDGKYNISGSVEVSNLELAQKVANLLHKPLHYEMVDFCPDRPRHDMRYAVDDSSLRALGWREIVSFDEGLERVVRSET
jgi:dTDP-glucose 4,6-dehydratase